MPHPARRCASTILLAGALLVSGPASADEYSSSVVGTEFDFIVDHDPTTFLCLEYQGVGPREMPDKTGESALIQTAFVYLAHFEDGTRVDVAVDGDFETEAAARAEAERYGPRLGKLPTALRSGVERLVVHRGEEGATAFSDVGLIVVYSDNATKRISTHDLEETLFHESVHAAWDAEHADSKAWRRAQKKDRGFVTRYARENPDGEDLAESALFAYTLTHHPDRIPPADAQAIRRAIPARIAFVERLLPRKEPIFHEVGPRYVCDGSARTFSVRGVAPDPEVTTVELDAAATECTVNVESTGGMADILSNALLRGLDREEAEVKAFLKRARGESANGAELLAAAAREFGVERAVLEAEVERFLHCNCDHEGP
ncbi:MAG: hypothetical protein ACF8XB_18555 [Planctomycetota bacterium JB042]